MKITGKPLSSYLSAYIEGDLTETKRELLERELARDPKLRAELQAMSNVRKALRRFTEPEMPIGMSARILARTAETTERAGRLRGLLRSPITGLIFSTVACGLVLVALFSEADLASIIRSQSGIASEQVTTPYRNPQQQLIPGVNKVRAGGAVASRSLNLSSSASKRRVAQGRVAGSNRCMTVNSSSKSECKDKFEKWLDLARRDEQGFRLELSTVPLKARNEWLSEIDTYAKRTGMKFRDGVSRLSASGRLR